MASTPPLKPQSLSHIADFSIESLASDLEPFPLAPCWEMMVTGLLAHALLRKGFSLEFPISSKRGDEVALSGSDFEVSKGERLHHLHNRVDKGTTDICISLPSIAHFEIKTGAELGSKSEANRANIAKNLDRALSVKGYECILFLLVAKVSYYDELRRGEKGRISDANWDTYKGFNSFFPDSNTFKEKTTSTCDTAWKGTRVEHHFRRVKSAGSEDTLIDISMRKQFANQVFN
jgi:hypothetical protein